MRAALTKDMGPGLAVATSSLTQRQGPIVASTADWVSRCRGEHLPGLLKLVDERRHNSSIGCGRTAAFQRNTLIFSKDGVWT